MNQRASQKRQTRQAFFQAVLALSMQGQSFASLSLRQLSREVGVVPTAFYRHFADMDALGAALVNEELGTALHRLRDDLKVGQTRTERGQLAHMVGLFFANIDQFPLYWHFIISERYAGHGAVQQALAEQIGLFVQILTQDLGLQPKFCHLPASHRGLIADMGVNMFFSWVQPWLLAVDTAAKQTLTTRCTKQAQILFYGVSNWQPVLTAEA